MTLLSPLNGVFLIVHVVVLVVIVYAAIDSFLHTDAAYRAAGKLHKTAWVTILIVAFAISLAGFLSVVGLIAALVYLLDVRPAVRGISGGSSRKAHTVPGRAHTLGGRCTDSGAMSPIGSWPTKANTSAGSSLPAR